MKPPETLTLDGVEYTIGDLAYSGDICDLYACTYEAEPDLPSKKVGFIEIRFK